MSKEKRIHWMVRGRQSCGRKIDRYRHCDLGLCSFEQVSRCWRAYTYVCTQNVECGRVLSVKGWRRAAHRAAAAAGMRITSSSNGRALWSHDSRSESRAKRSQECLNTSMNALNRAGSYRLNACSQSTPFAVFKYGFLSKELAL